MGKPRPEPDLIYGFRWVATRFAREELRYHNNIRVATIFSVVGPSNQVGGLAAWLTRRVFKWQCCLSLVVAWSQIATKGESAGPLAVLVLWAGVLV